MPCVLHAWPQVIPNCKNCQLRAEADEALKRRPTSNPPIRSDCPKHAYIEDGCPTCATCLFKYNLNYNPENVWDWACTGCGYITPASTDICSDCGLNRRDVVVRRIETQMRAAIRKIETEKKPAEGPPAESPTSPTTERMSGLDFD